MSTVTNLGLNPNRMVQQLQASLGVHPVNFGAILSNGTNWFIALLSTIAAWIFLAAELGMLLGGLAWLIGSAFHWTAARRTGWRIIGFSVLGYFIALIGPGILVAMYTGFHG